MYKGKTVYEMTDSEYAEFREYASGLEQGTDEWKEARLGIVTGSKVSDILPGTKGAYKASRQNYMIELITEILTGVQGESYYSADMARGNEKEQEGRWAYEGIKNVFVDTVGLILHPTIRGLGASPDGLIGTDRGLEIKCPKSATHVQTMIYGKINSDYIPQMVTGMLCTERPFWDFVSFDDRFPAENQIVVIEHKLEDFQTEAELIVFEVNKFLAEMQELLQKVRKSGDKTA